MIKYVVKINIDRDEYLRSIESKEKRYTKIKGWDGESPLYGSGKCYSLRLTPKVEMAMQYNREKDAYKYAYDCVDGCYRAYAPIINAEIVQIEFSPKELGVTRTYIPKHK